MTAIRPLTDFDRDVWKACSELARGNNPPVAIVDTGGLVSGVRAEVVEESLEQLRAQGYVVWDREVRECLVLRGGADTPFASREILEALTASFVGDIPYDSRMRNYMAQGGTWAGRLELIRVRDSRLAAVYERLVKIWGDPDDSDYFSSLNAFFGARSATAVLIRGGLVNPDQVLSRAEAYVAHCDPKWKGRLSNWLAHQKYGTQEVSLDNDGADRGAWDL